MKKNIATLALSILLLCSLVNAQSVGIGTNNPHPSALLDVTSNSKGVLVPRMRTADRTAIPNPEEGLLVFDMNTLSFWVYRGEPDGGWSELATNNNGLWKANGSTKIHTSNPGTRVGIGTDNPIDQLEINSTNGIGNTISMAINGTKYARFRTSFGQDFSSLDIQTLQPEGRIHLRTTSTELSVMHDQNSVVIGPTPYYGPTLIISDRQKDPEIRLARMFPNDGQTYWKGFMQIAGDNLRVGTNSENTEGKFVVRTAGTDRLAVDKNGNLGVGTLSPSVRLQVGLNGDGTVARANAWTTFSDERFKENIVTIENALDKIHNLNGYFYTWKNGEDKSRQAGLLAQEVEKVLPEIVSTDSEGYKSVDYGKMNALLLMAIKELIEKNKELEALIKSK